MQVLRDSGLLCLMIVLAISPIDLVVHNCLISHQWIALSVQSCPFIQVGVVAGWYCKKIYSPLGLAIMWKNDWSSFTESFQTNYVMMLFEFLLVTRVYRDTINLFCAHLMAICKEIHLNTMVSIYRYNRKLPYDALFRGSSRLSKFGVIRWICVGEVFVWSFVGPWFISQT